MPTAYIKKLAKLNHTTVNKIEKFWAQAKEIAKSEGNGKAWGLITTIFQNKLKKEGYKVGAFTSLADTDELDDADLGINVDPKEYHKQKSLQMSLQSKLDMIKEDLNKEADEYNEELVQWAKELNKRNRRGWTNDNESDRWLYYKGPVNEEVILKAFAEGHYNNSNENYYKNRPDVLMFKKSSIFKTYQRLLKNKSVVLYRGLHFKDDSDLNYWIPFLKYNLMDRNSWTTSIRKAKVYSKIGNPKCSIVLKIECTLDKINLPLSAWLEGSWFLEQNREVNLKKSFEVEDISIVDYTGDVGSLVKQFNKAVAKVKGTDMKTYIYKNKRITASSKEDAIQKIAADSKKPKIDMKVVNKWAKKNMNITDEGLGKDHWKDKKTGEVYYTWDAAVRLANKVSGYHLPNVKEWNDLALACGAICTNPNEIEIYKDFDSCQELIRLLNIKLVGDYYRDKLNHFGKCSNFWTSDRYDRNRASSKSLGSLLSTYATIDNYGCSVRLVRD